MSGRAQAGALLLMLATTLLLPSAASAVTIDWVTVGGAVNAYDGQLLCCFGAVAITCRISKYETTWPSLRATPEFHSSYSASRGQPDS